MHKYHARQFEKTYRSTEVFVDWLEKKHCFTGGNILDVGSGAGANLRYMAQKYPACDFWGVDYNAGFPDNYNNHHKTCNSRMLQGDVYRLKEAFDVPAPVFDGIISFQFLSWIADYKAALDNMISLEPKWLAASALFFEGDVQYIVAIETYDDLSSDNSGVSVSGCGHQNVYSIDLFRRILRDKGYSHFEYTKFDIDIDISMLNPRKPGTYTETLLDGRRLQISANFLMPWYFIYAER